MPAHRKSKEQHFLEGTKSRMPLLTVGINPGRPETPENLTPEVKAYFESFCDQLESMGTLELMDVYSLVLMAETQNEVKELSDFIANNGRTYTCTTESGVMVRPYPEVSMYQDAAKRLAALYKEYGLTMASRARLNIGRNQPKERNEFEDV
jgi:P27 family predicted phage terminase small subunit